MEHGGSLILPSTLSCCDTTHKCSLCKMVMLVRRRLENNMELTQANVRHLQLHLAQFQVSFLLGRLEGV